MLDTLRRIIQEVNRAPNIDRALEVIVRRVKQAMGVEVCSIYLSDLIQQEHILMATDGLKPESTLMVRLRFGEGLVSQVASRAELVNLADAPNHPSYRYFPESGEEEYHGFLGVPIIYHRDVLGILVVQQHKSERFDEDSVTLLITIAAQLAGAIAHAEASGEIASSRELKHIITRPLQGLPGAPGVAIGTAVTMYEMADIDAVPDRKITNVEQEVKAFSNAVSNVKRDIKSLSERLAHTLPAEDKLLFDAYLLMLDSDTLLKATLDCIEEGNWAPGALRKTIQEHMQIFNDMEDPYLRERAEDIRDLGQRILRYLQEDKQQSIDYPDDIVLVTKEISAAMLAEVPVENLAGIVATGGSRTSHMAIVARALNIPTVMGVVDLPVGYVDGHQIIADGYSGRVYVTPSNTILEEYKKLAEEEAVLSTELNELHDLESQTQDGIHIPLHVNSGLLLDITQMRNSGAEGVGLYRTEFPFMLGQRFPGEEEQRRIYREVLEAFSPHPVTLRTLDVGGDKSLPYFPINEDNPFLGWRGIRITLDHPEIFLVQVRAMIRAASGLDNLNLLLPMISTASELDESVALIYRAYLELLDEGEESISMPKIGVMIEVPSAVYLAKALAQRIDFLSIGSNDLTQYLMAVDRNNPNVAQLYDPLHPAVLRAIFQVVEDAHAVEKPVSICGEMAGDPVATLVLLGMGLDCLSMNVSSLLRIKRVIRNFTQERAREILQKVLPMEEARSVRKYLTQILEDAGMGGLVRAGK